MSGLLKSSPTKEIPLSLETVKQQEPVIAWKVLVVDYHRPYWHIMSQYNGDIIEPVKAIAKCDNKYSGESDNTVPVPDVNCTCGFYGYKDHTKLQDETKWLAKVRFYGKVIEGEHGYRAEKQDILEIWAPENNGGGSAYQWPMRKLELLERQFPTIKWHFPELPKVAPPSVLPNSSGSSEVHVHYPGGDPYDILSKEMMEALRPGSSIIVTLPITTNYAYGMMLRVTVQNQSLSLEFMDMNNQIVGRLSLTGTRYWWKS